MVSIKRPNLTFVFQSALILSLVFLYVYQWTTMILSPSLRTGTDFISYYAVGRIAQEHGFSKIYDIGLQRQYQEGQVGFSLDEKQVLLYLHVPYTAPIIALVTGRNYTFSFICWAILMAGLYIITAELIGMWFFQAVEAKAKRSIFIGVMSFFPLFYSLLLGQDTAILFLGGMLWLAGLFKKNDSMAALGLALTTVRPHVCLTLAIPTLFTNRRVWLRFTIFAGALALLSLLLIGKEGMIDFVHILRVGASGEWFGMNERDMPNFIGLFMRLCTGCDTSLLRSFGWIMYGIGIAAATLFWRRNQRSELSSAGLTTLIALFTAPHLHYHDLTLLLIPMVVLIQQEDECFGKRPGLMLPVASFLLAITQSLFFTPYLVIALLVRRILRAIQSSGL